MGLKDIVVLLDPSPAGEERLRLATRIARDQGAYLSAILVRPHQAVDAVPADVLRRGVATQALTRAGGKRRNGKTSDEAEQRMRENLRWFGDNADWHDVEQAASSRLIALIRTADLIILGQVSRDVRPGPSWRPDEILVGCGRPVLMVPYTGTFPELGRRVLVAWDGSRESARALNDALPMIRTATAVTVMSIRTRDRDLPRHREATQRVVRHLARHDIAARADHPLRGGDAISDILLSAATDISADLIVAGAYHHSPLRQAVIGGVSRGLLQHMTVPVLMSH
jgi:nucleotide-binding universal stress UspA family protein